MPRRRGRLPWKALLAVAVALVLLAGGALWGNVLGIGDRAESLAREIELVIDPPPDRPIDEEVLVTEESAEPVPTLARETPDATDAPGTSAAPASSAPASASAPAATPPPRVAVDVNLYPDHPERRFITEIDHDWCAVAGTQMVLAAWGKAPLTEAFQRRLAGRIDEWESRRDSRNGGWGPAAIVNALRAYDVPGYEVRAYKSRQEAMRDAARAVQTYRAPVLLMTWRGAHTWVMTGFRADADPVTFRDARITGTYILDPWYPRVSSIWGASDPPGTFQDLAEMQRNYLPWKRPEGKYPTRDGLFLAIVPTQQLP